MHVGTGSKAHLNFFTLGDYHDSWARIDGKWRMTHRTKHSHASQGSIEVLGAGPQRLAELIQLNIDERPVASGLLLVSPPSTTRVCPVM